LLRETNSSVSRDALTSVWPDALQRDRAVLSLLDDGLVVVIGDKFGLPELS
jgi:A/G-specific adenine glycosylase